MKKYLDYISKFHENKQNEIDFVNNQLTKHLKTEQENQTEIEHILDFLYSTKKSYKNIGYKTILAKVIAWDKKLQSLSSKDDELEGVDYEVVYAFGDGYKFVKLMSQSAYNREGKLMSHCVSSYYGRDVAIYSLRDSNNKPHCTIEENNQVKGKGNQTVDNKYFGYCIKFLEHMGFSIGENEMKNIGFHKLDSIDEGLTCEELRDGKYVSEKNLDKIKDKGGNTYMGFGLLKIKKLFEFDLDMKVKFNFDIDDITSYFRSNLNTGDINKEYNNKVAMTNHNEVAMTHSNKVAMTNHNKVAMTNHNKVAMTHSNEVAMTHSNEVAMTHSNEVAMTDYNRVAMANYNRVAMTHSNEVAMTHSNEVAMTNYNKVAMTDYNNCVGINNNIISSGVNNAILMGNDSKVKGKKGTIIVLYHRDDNGDIIDYATGIVDGITLKEDIFYKLEGGKFVECIL